MDTSMIRIQIQKALQSATGKMNLELELHIREGAFATIYGASGAGKTSTLRMIAGLMTPEKGMIIFNDRVWFDEQQKINLPPQERNIGFVFQDYELFPHMTVRRNLEFAAGKGHEKNWVDHLIERVELGELQHMRPAQLSGGQQQRVALARALVQRPDILLLDEPLSALDTRIRSKLQGFIRSIHDDFGITTLMVSHDIGEVFYLSDVVFELEDGKIVRKGSPAELFMKKQGNGSLQLAGKVLKVEKVDAETTCVMVRIGAQVTSVNMARQKAATLQNGDRIVLETPLNDPDIFKIEE